jgi:membrane protein insertase Oxa1/YidC/SpoIIIJ
MLFLGFMWNYKKTKQIRALEGELKELKKKIETVTTGEKAVEEQQQQVYP